uniref:Uncharacterized protein n=1 Tax=Pyxicephalus adspersus TaxID=30357 RepID=A0AAV3A742_PYXAD|nr:TPA: hypothetical protein GDO54_012634 [Pyxicephalus adspersus]
MLIYLKQKYVQIHLKKVLCKKIYIAWNQNMMHLFKLKKQGFRKYIKHMIMCQESIKNIHCLRNSVCTYHENKSQHLDLDVWIVSH